MVYIYAYLAVALSKLAAVRFVAGRVGVLDDFQLHILQSLQRPFGSMDVGLPDVEVVDLYTTAFCLLGIGYELAYRRCRHLPGFFG